MSEELARIETTTDLSTSPVMNLVTAKKRIAELQEFVKEYLVENEDFGVIPGTKKPTLLKPGADKLCEIYGLSDDYEIVSAYSREDWDRDPPLFDYTVKCILTSKRTGGIVATGIGSCNSYEARYKYRESARKCPKCGNETIIKGKEEFGGGWLCWAKKGGCGAKFNDGDAAIESQKAGKVPNEDIASLKNTVLKMSQKRSKIAATLSATRSSGVFSQDLEDIPEGALHKDAERKAGSEKQPEGKKQAESKKPEAKDVKHVTGPIDKLEERTTKAKDKKPGKPFLELTVQDTVFHVWDAKIFEGLKSAKRRDHEVELTYTDRLSADKKRTFHEVSAFSLVVSSAREEVEPPDVDDEEVLSEAAGILGLDAVEDGLRESYSSWKGEHPDKSGTDFLQGLRG